MQGKRLATVQGCLGDRVAFANTDGGMILLGVAERAGQFEMFYEIGWAEQKGTGIRAMQQAMYY